MQPEEQYHKCHIPSLHVGKPPLNVIRNMITVTIHPMFLLYNFSYVRFLFFFNLGLFSNYSISSKSSAWKFCLDNKLLLLQSKSYSISHRMSDYSIKTHPWINKKLCTSPLKDSVSWPIKIGTIMSVKDVRKRGNDNLISGASKSD